MIKIKNEKQIELLEKAGEIVYDTHQELKKHIKCGITTDELNDIAESYIISQNATPSFKNYHGYPKSICTSINEEVVHGIPSNRKLKNGDIVSIDIGAYYKGYHSDSAWTYPVGDISEDKAILLEKTENSLYKGLEVIKEGCTTGDIGNAIESYLKKYNLGIVEVLVGHGVGSELHEPPDIPNYGKKKTGPVLKAGMVIAVEPMINLGAKEVLMLEDEWTIVTADGKPSVHFEHTVLVLKEGFKILTKRWLYG